jgi:hypothetical protein
MNKKPDYIFKCKKCKHLIYVNKLKVYKLLKRGCPECGEEPEKNWLLCGCGDWKKEYQKEN